MSANKLKDGIKVKDAFMAIIQTANQLGVNVYDYIYNGVSGRFQLPALAFG